MSNPTLTTASKPLRIGLWLSQTVLALVYVPAGAMKLFSPVAQVAAQIPWAADVPSWFVRIIGVVDLSAGLGILLPALTRITPGLTIWAARGSIVLQICAMFFHGLRNEWAVLPFNAFLIALAVFIAWGRSSRAPIAARGA